MSLRSLVVAVGLMAAVACGKTPTDPPPPPPEAPTVVCPTSSSIESPGNVPMPVTFTAPTTTGGQAPVSVTCTALSGATFPLGSTIVTCTATDALQRQASCNFNVTVTVTPRISKTTFLAFGDSITAGIKTDPLAFEPARTTMRPFGLGPSHSYPYKLNDLLAERYKQQLILVNSEGQGGELASAALTAIWTDDGRTIGEVRIRQVLLAYQPQVVLIMEGTNDLYFGEDEAASYAMPALARMIDEARGIGTEVFLATVPPQRPGRDPKRTRVAELIPGFNEEIRALAQQKNVTLVDVFAVLNTNLNLYIGNDDLHPTEAGYQAIADVFFDAIKAKLDTTPASIFGIR